MKQTELMNPDLFEVGLYGLVYYHGFYKQLAGKIGAKPAGLRQSLNPGYHERPSFVSRCAHFFIAWIRLSPRKGIEAFCLFVSYVQQAIPTADTVAKLTEAQSELQAAKRLIESVNQELDDMPAIRWQMHEVVKTHRRRKRRVLKQPTI